MNNQEKLTPENLQFIQKDLANYDLTFKIIPAFLVVMFLFAIFATGEGFMSITAVFMGILLTGSYVLIRRLLKRKQSNIQTDVTNGIKEIIEGFISKKKHRKQSFSFHINEVEYAVESVDFNKFEQKDYVKMEVLPLSKTVLSIIAIPQ